MIESIWPSNFFESKTFSMLCCTWSNFPSAAYTWQVRHWHPAYTSHYHTHMQTHHTITHNSRIAFWCCFLSSASMGVMSSIAIFGNLKEETYKQATTQALHNTHKHARSTYFGHSLAILQWPYQHRRHWRHSWMNLGRQGFLFGLWFSWMLQIALLGWLFCLSVCAF